MIRLVKEISQHQRSWRNDPRIQKWTRQSELLSETDQARWLNKIEDDPSIQMFGIWAGEEKKWPGFTGIREEGHNVGTCGLTSINLLHRTAEFSLLIGPEYQRKGYGRAALTQLLTYGFSQLGLECIWGETFKFGEEVNPAMILFKELGFQEEGNLRSRYYKHGQRIDTIIFSMLRSQWNC